MTVTLPYAMRKRARRLERWIGRMATEQARLHHITTLEIPPHNDVRFLLSPEGRSAGWAADDMVRSPAERDEAEPARIPHFHVRWDGVAERAHPPFRWFRALDLALLIAHKAEKHDCCWPVGAILSAATPQQSTQIPNQHPHCSRSVGLLNHSLDQKKTQIVHPPANQEFAIVTRVFVARKNNLLEQSVDFSNLKLGLGNWSSDGSVLRTHFCSTRL